MKSGSWQTNFAHHFLGPNLEAKYQSSSLNYQIPDAADMKARNSEVVRLFPTFVWKSQLDEPTCNAINQTIHAQLPQLPGTRVGGAWQSGPGLHKLDALRELV